MSNKPPGAPPDPQPVYPPPLGASFHVETPEFEQDAFDHVRECFPDLIEEMGLERTMELVDHGIDRALHWNFHDPRDVISYIEVVFTLGRDFDVDERCKWANEILTSKEFPHPRARAERLTEATIQYITSLVERLRQS